MFKKIMSVYFLPFFFITVTTLRAEVIAQIDTLDDHTKIVHLSIPVKEGDLVYSDYLAVSVDDAQIECSDWQANSPIFVTFDPVFNKDKKAFKGDAKISFSIQSKKDLNACTLAKIHVNYYLKSLNTMVEEVIPLTLLTTAFPNPALETQIDIPSQENVEPTTASVTTDQPQPEAQQPSLLIAFRVP